jgi:outer membrane protein OmpA-like peptidoglycan-associated protein
MTEEDYFGHELGVRFANDVETTINFAFNSAELDATAQDILVSQAA